MINFLIGLILGIAIATVGIQNVAKVFDKGVTVVKEQSIKLAAPEPVQAPTAKAAPTK